MNFNSFKLGDIVFLEFKGEYMPKGDDAIYLIRGIKNSATCTQMIFEPAGCGGWIIGIVREYIPILIVSLAHDKNEEFIVHHYESKYRPFLNKNWTESNDWYVGTAFIEGRYQPNNNELINTKEVAQELGKLFKELGIEI